jgi:hypothetical protein
MEYGNGMMIEMGGAVLVVVVVVVEGRSVMPVRRRREGERERACVRVCRGGRTPGFWGFFGARCGNGPRPDAAAAAAPPVCTDCVEGSAQPKIAGLRLSNTE